MHHSARWSGRPSGKVSTGLQLSRMLPSWFGAAGCASSTQSRFTSQLRLFIPFPCHGLAVWGLDILGPFPRAIGGYEYLYVTIDKFTKWPEAVPVVKVTKNTALQF